jgi:hypothetical protein
MEGTGQAECLQEIEAENGCLKPFTVLDSPTSRIRSGEMMILN